jgi:large subunit ribosomal protein L6
MSRIGKSLIIIPKNVTINIMNKTVNVKGPKGCLSQHYPDNIKIILEKNQLRVIKLLNNKISNSIYGLYRSLFYNMIYGVSVGFNKTLELIGVGYKVVIHNNNVMEFNLGYSHNIIVKIPDIINLDLVNQKGKNTLINLSSYDKQLLGIVSAQIRSLRKPDTYKGKGLRYITEFVKIKVGKTAK